MPERKNKPIWWEKTVEYAYIARLANEKKLDYAAPLSGSHEHDGGDGLFGTAAGFILVEFKRRHSDLPSEVSMFRDFNLALNRLEEFHHHYFIYGAISQNRLQLRACRYFGSKSREHWFDVIDILKTGIPKDEFLSYLELLASFKETDARSGGGKHVSPESFCAVLGISQDGQVVETITLHEFAPKLFPAPPTPDFTPYSPAPGMR